MDSISNLLEFKERVGAWQQEKREIQSTIKKKTYQRHKSYIYIFFKRGLRVLGKFRSAALILYSSIVYWPGRQIRDKNTAISM